MAALYVVIHHMFGGTDRRVGMEGLLENWMGYGHLAVDVFIVLSGYCLMLSVKSAGEFTSASTLDFYLRRARRILPPVYAAIIYYMMTTILSTFLESHSVIESLHAHPSLKKLLINVFLLNDVLPDYTIALILWSVALEWRIYFLFPLLVNLYRRRGALIVTALCGLIGYGLLVPLLHFYTLPRIFFMCPWYLLLFSFGMCAAPHGYAYQTDKPHVSNNRLGSLIWMAAIVAAIALMLSPVAGMGNEAVFGRSLEANALWLDPIIGGFTSLCLILLHRQVIEGRQSLPLRFFSSKPVVWIGRISFSLYLSHNPLLHFTQNIFEHFHVLHTPAGLLAWWIVTPAVAIGFAYIFFLLFERPFLSSQARKAATKPVGEMIKEG